MNSSQHREGLAGWPGERHAFPGRQGRGSEYSNFRLARSNGSLGKREPMTAEHLLQTKVYPMLTESSAELHVHTHLSFYR